MRTNEIKNEIDEIKKLEDKIIRKDLKYETNIHTHTHTYIYIYIYSVCKCVCVCVCVCVRVSVCDFQ